MNSELQDCREQTLYPIVRYLYDCLSAQTEWGRNINVLTEKDTLLVPLTHKQQRQLGTKGSLSVSSPEAVELGNRFATAGSDVSVRLGALFLVGRLPAFGDKPERSCCAPLLEVPLELERDLSKGAITVAPEDEEFSINLSLVGEVLRTNREDLQDRLADLGELVPDFPIEPSEFRDFWNGFRMIAAGLPLAEELPKPRRRRRKTKPAEASDVSEDVNASAAEVHATKTNGSTADEESQPRIGKVDDPEPLEIVDFFVPRISKDGLFRLLPATTIILGKRAGHIFSALRELEGMTRQRIGPTGFGSVFGLHSGCVGETGTPSELDSADGPSKAAATTEQPEVTWPGIEVEPTSSSRPAASRSSGQVVLDLCDAHPLPLTAAQRAVVHSARSAPLTVVTGPPGTGKSYTITAIVLDAILGGQSVLVASQMDKAVEVVARKVEKIAGPFAMARSGGRAAQRALADKIKQLTGPKAQWWGVRNYTRWDCEKTAERHGELSRRVAQLEQRYRETVKWEQVWCESHEVYERIAPICPLPIHEISPKAHRRAKASARRARAALVDEPGCIKLPLPETTLKDFVRARQAAKAARALLKGKPGLFARWRAWRLKRRAVRLFGAKPPRKFSVDDVDKAIRHWWGQWHKRRALDSLRAPESWECSLDELDEAVLVQEHFMARREAEQKLRAPFAADLLWQEIENVEGKRTEQALKLLRRNRGAVLYALVNSWRGPKGGRGQLRLFGTLLRRRSRKLKRELRKKIDLSVPLRAFPAWASTNRALGQILPPTPGLFDLVVIDEASQCDLATAAVALLRGKRAVIVGDPNQLRHVSFLSKTREHASFVKHGLDTDLQERFRYRRSLFDVASDAVRQDSFFMLDQHFRSDPHIIDFSNRKFYDGQLRIMTERPRREPGSAVRCVTVAGKRSEGSSANPAEVQAVLAEVAAVVDEGKAADQVSTIGIVSPFRDHVDAIHEQLVQQFSSADIEKHDIVIGTAHSLQGDEKDIVIFTTSIDTECHSASLRFLENPNLFNVAVTRARRRLVVVTSVAADDLPAGLLREFVQHAQCVPQPHLAKDLFDNEFERHVVGELRKQHLEAWPNYRSAGLRIDVVVSMEGRNLALICDGPPPGPDDTVDPLTCHRVLARAGWEVRRVSRRSWLASWYDCLQYITKALQQMIDRS